MAYRHDGSGMGGPVPEKTVAWLYGFLFGALTASTGLAVLWFFYG